MANTVIELRHSYVTGNVPSSLANGELAINTYDGKLFYRGGASNTIQTIERYQGPAGLNGEIQFNDSGVLGSSANLTFNKTTDILSAKNLLITGNSYFENSNLHEGITQLSVTNSGSSGYLFDQYFGNNPSLYVGAGETISFNLNVSGHPFLIRESSGGANTSAGLTHISTTGVVSTGADAQGKVSGILFWKIPFSLIGSTYVYQCQVHSGMVGNIVIQQPASFVASNTTLAFNHANAAFNVANAATAIDTTQNNSIAAAFIAANSAGVYANSAFEAANAATATDVTQNNSITAAFTTANSAGVYANGAFAAANAATATDITQNNSIIAAFTAANSAGVYANGAFARANNSLNANTGGTVTANVTISANLTAANVATQTYIQFSDGSKQYTANAGGGGGSTSSFGTFAANGGAIIATTSNTEVTFVGEAGISVTSNTVTKKLTFSAPAGYTFTTADYGFVYEDTNVIYDYGTL